MIYLVILCLSEIQSISIKGDIICLKTIYMIKYNSIFQYIKSEKNVMEY